VPLDVGHGVGRALRTGLDVLALLSHGVVDERACGGVLLADLEGVGRVPGMVHEAQQVVVDERLAVAVRAGDEPLADLARQDWGGRNQ